MSLPMFFQRHRHPVLLGAAVLSVLLLLVLLHRPLVAWFTGKPMGGRTSAAVAERAGSLRLAVAVHPDPPRQQGDSLHIEVKDGRGAPVDHARLTVTYDMGAMGTMQEMRGGGRVTEEGHGHYRADLDLPMSGTWTLAIDVSSAVGTGSARYSLTVGSRGLIPLGEGAPSGEQKGVEDGIAYYTCSMHPSVKQQAPGTCPICGMTLQPVTKKEVETGVITVDRQRWQLYGVRIGKAVRRPLRVAIRALGHVTYDEEQLADVNLKLRGWIRRLYVDKMGQAVRRGQPLFLLYSPELYAAEQDLLQALHSQAAARETSAPGRADYLLRGARQRLRLWDISDAQVDEIARKDEPLEDVPILSPASGYVIEKNVVAGAAIEPGQRLYRIAPLDRVWVEAEVYEDDLPLLHAGQQARVSLSYVPGKSWEGRVAYVYPYLRGGTRTGMVRIQLGNRALELRPDMYASVELMADLGERLQVPESAVIYTGPRRLVFLDLGEGRLRPQEVEIGRRSQDHFYEVLRGLQEGQSVVTSGNFLVSAESRIRSAAPYWGGGDDDK